MSTATHRITKPRAFAMRTILGTFSFPVPVCSSSEALAYVVISGTADACMHDTDKPALVGSYIRIKWTAGGCGLHSEDAAARSALIPPPAQPLTAAAAAAAASQSAATPLQAAGLIKEMQIRVSTHAAS